MRINNVICIPSGKFYEEPKFEGYNIAKNAYYDALDPEYKNKSAAKKWEFLIARLGNTVKQEHLPPGCNRVQFVQALDAFKTNRENTYAARTNLQLHQCVNYFDNFLFMYSNTDDKYKLSDAGKTSVLTAIYEVAAGHICETGINGRLYTALQENQKETDWIQNELTKARCEALRQLHAEYLQYNGTGDALNVHDYNSLVLLANKKHLGIPMAERVDDMYANAFSTAKLEEFFDKNYSRIFAEYERQAVVTITTQYMNEITTTLALTPEVKKIWEKDAYVIPADQIQAMSNHLQMSLNMRFDGVELTGVTDKLLIGEDDFVTFKLAKKSEFAQQVAELVRKKLLHEKYYLDLEEVAAHPKEHKNIPLLKEVKLKELVKAHLALKNHDGDALSKLNHVLTNYPELLSDHIEINPSIVVDIPNWLRMDVRFMERVIESFDRLLLEAIQRKDEAARNGDAEQEQQEIAKIIELSKQLLTLIQSEYGYLNKLSESLFANYHFAATLLEKNSLLFGKLNGKLQQNDTLRHLAINNIHYATGEAAGYYPAIYAEHQDLLDKIPAVARYQFRTTPLESFYHYSSAISNLLKIQAYHKLCSHTVSVKDFLNNVHQLTPDQLLEIINYREANTLKPLPYFDNAKAVKVLKKFNKSISQRLKTNWNEHDDYLHIKKIACEIEDNRYVHSPYQLKSAVTFLAKTPDWFVAFKQYNTYQSSFEKKFARLLRASKGLLNLIISSAKLALLFGLVIYVFPLLWQFVSSYFLYGFVLWASLALLNLVIRNPILGTINTILWHLITLDIQLLIAVALRIGFLVVPFLTALGQTLDGVFSLVGMVFGVFTPSNKNKLPEAQSLEEMCDQTELRLQTLDEKTAQEKVELLQQVRSQIQVELATSAPGQHTLKELVTKEYPVKYRGEEHDVSYVKIAATPRPTFGSFEVTSGHGFFSRRTTSEKFLIACEPTLGLNI